MDYTAFITIFLVLQGLCLWLGGRSSKEVSSQDDYFLAGRNVRFFPLMMTFLATQVGGCLFLGGSEEAYQYGWSVLLYPLGAAVGILLLGAGIGGRLAALRIATVAQIFEVVYRSPLLKKVASLLSIATLFMILVSQFVGSSKFMVSLGVESRVWFILFWSIVIVYTALGGFKAVVVTDIIQAAFFVVVFLATFGYVMWNQDASMAAGQATQSFDAVSTKLYGWLFMPLLFMVIEQDMGQRCFSAESPRTISKAALWAAAGTLLMGAIAVFFGVLAQSLEEAPPTGSSVLMFAVMQMTNPWIAALVASAVLCAIISTADSLINAIGSNLVQDFGLPKDVKVSQFLSVVIALSALTISFFFTNIVDIMVVSYELSVCCLFVPIFFGLWMKRGSVLSAALAIAFGAVGFVLFKIVPYELPRELLSVGLSLLGFAVGELARNLSITFFYVKSAAGGEGR